MRTVKIPQHQNNEERVSETGNFVQLENIHYMHFFNITLNIPFLVHSGKQKMLTIQTRVWCGIQESIYPDLKESTTTGNLQDEDV